MSQDDLYDTIMSATREELLDALRAAAGEAVLDAARRLPVKTPSVIKSEWVVRTMVRWIQEGTTIHTTRFD